MQWAGCYLEMGLSWEGPVFAGGLLQLVPPLLFTQMPSTTSQLTGGFCFFWSLYSCAKGVNETKTKPRDPFKGPRRLLKGPRGPFKRPRGPLKATRGPLKGPRGPFKGPRGPLKGPRDPFKGPQGPLKGPRGPFKGSRGPFKRLRVL